MLCLLSSGSNAHGQLGNGTFEDAHTFRICFFEDQDLSSLPNRTSRVIKVATGANHTLVLLDFDDQRPELWGCGDGRKGQLGFEYGRNTQTKPSPTFKKIRLSVDEAGFGGYEIKFIEATWETSYAVLASEGNPDVVISFGSDDYGDLGIGGRLEEKITEKDFHVVRFDHIFPSEEVMKINSISSGQRHVILQIQTPSSSFLVGWGLCRHGQLGSGSSKNTSFSSLPQVIPSDPSLFDDRSTSCALGIHHTVVCRALGSVVGFGSNKKGQLQVVEQFSTNPGPVKSVQCTWNGSYLLVENQCKWEIWSSGSNSRSQLGRESIGDDVGLVEFHIHLDSGTTSVSVACGSEHVLALVAPSSKLSTRIPQVWGWGWNEHGNLGLGHTEDVATPVQCWPQSSDGEIVDVCGVWAGSGTSWICARMVDGPPEH